ncbi:4Fe-4S binding protein [Desulfobacula toluolica]|uniref:4Fe-4S ferredoxin, iron-sulfur binding domain protein n=1 Tax=Desulfobacula toluolica (strain DSM 7467 / Tol2) TaxID=651182 RepID=K0N5F0_DESTT|nr:4Fe-4S binding protein [Desulfobacula toluolica]CCK79329.1 4Fe-4S ferredoxin, iron-sulfur binding domain protein [Desulfobacula toluolica Tol2]
MIDRVKQKINELLSDDSVKGVVALVTANGHVAPCLFQKGDDLDKLCLGDTEKPGDARYPLNKVLVTIARQYPEDVFGVLVRGCDERGLYSLYRLNQLDPDKVISIGITCPESLAQACECKKPYPDEISAGEKAEAASQQGVTDMDDKDLLTRFSFWMEQFSKCVKCYGCRNICPMCFCKECSLECEELVSKGDLPVDIPVFHLTRAMHMADRCIDCGLCEEACPSDIPLRLLYKKTSKIMNDEFGFTSGINKNEKSPLSLMGPAPEN